MFEFEESGCNLHDKNRKLVLHVFVRGIRYGFRVFWIGLMGNLNVFLLLLNLLFEEEIGEGIVRVVKRRRRRRRRRRSAR